MSKSALLGLLGSVAMRCMDDQVDEGAPPVPPAAGMWPRVIRAAGYDELGNLVLEGIDDNDHTWHEEVAGRGQEAWLLKQLYMERRFGRRNKKYSLKKQK